MPLDFVKSQKGQDQLVRNGYLFVKEKADNEKVSWKCTFYKKAKCHARIQTQGDAIVKESGEHNHAPEAAKIAAKNVVAQMKERACTNQESTHQVVADTVTGLAPAVQGQMANVSLLKRTVQRVRQRQADAPANPRTIEELLIPGEYQLTAADQQFLLYDSGAEDRQRMLIFSTQRNLELLFRSPHWYADGTFKTSPPLFQQLYTVHGIHFHNVIPAVYALFTNKTEDTYRRFLSKLKELEPDLQPQTVMTDFELAAINAFQVEFSGARNRGCFFHMGQCVWRRVQQDGFQHRYANEPDFALAVRQLPALAFVPLPDVVHAFKQLSNSLPAEMQPIVDYFEDNWIGRLNRRNQRRTLTFPLQLWNCYDNVIDGLPKTNNAVEGWHREFAEIVSASHPTIFKFIAALQRQHALNEAKIEQFIASQQPPCRRRKYRNCAKNVKRIVEDYANHDILDYLRGLAHNFNF